MRLILRALARVARSFADWCDPGGAVLPVGLVATARQVVKVVNQTPHTSAYKRALAMKALRQRTSARGRDIGLAIELAVREAT